jgi:toxin ParE1/3/4
MSRIELAPGAWDDLKESFNWYLARSPESAIRFENAVNEALSLVATDPMRFPKVDRRHQRCPLAEPFDFDLIYRRENDRIYVVAIAHHSRRPKYWRRR